MDVVIRLGVRIEMHWPLFSIGTLQLNSSQMRMCGRVDLRILEPVRVKMMNLE